MTATFDEITERYDTYDDLVRAFKSMPKNHVEYKDYQRLIRWCNQ